MEIAQQSYSDVQERLATVLLSWHGALFYIYIAQHPDCTVSDIADAIAITRRTFWGLMGDLRRAGLVDATREGKQHY
jgi:DNA-binding MarR family transcriptional regulator